MTLSGVSVDESVAAGYTRTVGSWQREPVARDSNLALVFRLTDVFDFKKKNNADRLIFQSVSKNTKSRDVIQD